MHFAGIRYEIEKGLNYFPTFSIYDDFYIEITNGITIFVELNIYDCVKVKKILYDYKYNPDNELFIK
jgi:hypothetical protein